MIDDAEGQTFFWELGEPVRRKPTSDEIEAAVTKMTKIVVWKHHRGRPPRGMDWSDLYQEVSARTIDRLAKFTHGGAKTLEEYCYMAGYQSLKDIQRELMWTNEEPREYPLIERCCS